MRSRARQRLRPRLRDIGGAHASGMSGYSFKGDSMTIRSMLLPLVLALTATAAFAQDGREGDLDDRYAVEFAEIGRYIAEQLRANPIPEIDSRSFTEAVATTRVDSEERFSLEGMPADAIFYPRAVPPRIEFSREAWDGGVRSIDYLVVCLDTDRGVFGPESFASLPGSWSSGWGRRISRRFRSTSSTGSRDSRSSSS